MNNNYTISEYFTLPSEGKIYDTEVNPQINLRSMTTQEEMQRLTHSDKAYKPLCDIIDACMIDNPGISSYDMALGDYQYLLFMLRVVTYGSEYHGTATCPFCGTTNKSDFSIDDLPIKKYSEEIENYREFELPQTKSVIRIKPRTPRILDITQDRIKEFKAKKANVDSTIMFTLKSIIESIDGSAPSPVYFEEWIKNLPMRDTNTITNYSDKLDGALGVDTRLLYSCDMCGLPFNSVLKTDMEFFRPSLRF